MSSIAVSDAYGMPIVGGSALSRVSSRRTHVAELPLRHYSMSISLYIGLLLSMSMSYKTQKTRTWTLEQDRSEAVVCTPAGRQGDVLVQLQGSGRRRMSPCRMSRACPFEQRRRVQPCWVACSRLHSRTTLRRCR
jgi:hypothetical protein